EPILLGENEYFVMGDNRNDSMDSRYPNVGPITKDEMIGKAVFRLFPITKMGGID
ncbi:MAG: S26 family signal peptidase, partial [Lachnospiraceae bacterium]|nr:S26 family signal peptidase [Lachnospiraceae bacterium]